MKRKQRQSLDADFSAFVVSKGRQLVRLAELLTGDPHRAADLVQSALERAYPQWHRITADDPTAYVRRIVVNQHRDWWRRLRNRELPSELRLEEADPEDMTERHAQRSLVLGALARLTVRERTVVVLRYYGDLSEAQIAAELGIALGTVKSTLHRALAKLRAFPDLLGRLPSESADPCTKSEVSV
ncbi:SigE family RNA polymerase sigma factor [Kitasatospora sp. NPDC057223]|uniref:SigE family RNA polymerase sigma factor n=1 Tax=Kitasatospora sp. NPDC057223 TaxID=3346055 RepID=UPI003629D0A1